MFHIPKPLDAAPDGYSCRFVYLIYGRAKISNKELILQTLEKFSRNDLISFFHLN